MEQSQGTFLEQPLSELIINGLVRTKTQKKTYQKYLMAPAADRSITSKKAETWVKHQTVIDRTIPKMIRSANDRKEADSGARHVSNSFWHK